ncbi:TorD/DmsD family molecular chaperone [Campylobacter suis]|uniref:Tat proofreading chaperone DmsD n=1 Tax=Campylobacter suis TaxID=2790657 RepID=A0ABN7KAA4_9BACT|nr:molecular chaperone TorD family protein [Campylobacter suis]CAD7289458.1 Tat proofreading chaperone DmsD [Campylobacter suis]
MQVLQNSLVCEDILRRVFLVPFELENVAEICKLADELDEKFKAHSFIAELKKCSADKELTDEARYEYNRLFVGPRRPRAIPYESAYFDYKTLFGAHTLEVREIYKQAGLMVEADKFDKFPDDFIGYELQFLYFLTYNALGFLQNEQEGQFYESLKQKAEFISMHPSKWFSEFASRCAGEARLDVWRAFAEFLTLYLKDEELSLVKILAKAN